MKPWEYKYYVSQFWFTINVLIVSLFLIDNNKLKNQFDKLWLKEILRNSIVIFFVGFFLISVDVTEVFSQPVNYTKIFEEKFAFEYPSPYVENLMVNSTLVDVIYQTNTTVVFEGDLIEDYEYNKGIWEAMDFMKGEGFKVVDIMRTGEGTEDNPNTVFVTMSKWDNI